MSSGKNEAEPSLIKSSPAAFYSTGFTQQGLLKLYKDRLQFSGKNTSLGLVGLLLTKDKVRADIPLD